MPRRIILTVFAALATTVVAAAPASAHVSVQPGQAAKGGFATVAFQVPNEEDTANTVKVDVQLPTDNPIPSVSVQPVPGWTVATETTKLAKPVQTDDGELTEAVSRITWTATAGGVQPGQFQQFLVSMGPLPDTSQLVFKALQTYSNGDVVRWIDEPTSGASEPGHPAPTLKLTAASSDDHHGSTSATADSGASAAPASATAAT